ncbi:FAD-binding protein [Neptunicoccus cionae]|uniref:FAD-binding protein n=1 Tax=Neptunicoccus cionae TaxID=2035344 RepID=UPI000C764BB2|nr:FAD-binding protein [Amylibacter cionae]PLS21941.1 2-hydroxy-acid oxidase [Amylibacter cionae]
MRPDTEAELSAAIKEARGPLRIIGGGTRSIGRAQGDFLSTAGLSGISLYEPGALTIVAGAGTPLAEVEAALTAENQRLPFEPPQMGALTGKTGASTIGGVVAANASGPRRIQAGACRDSLIGVRFVDGRGDIIKNGGRVMKNVTGYDLVKLLAGSQGSLGVISEVAFKVLPGVEATATVVVHGLDDQSAVEAMSTALGSPYEVSGAAHDPARQTTMLRLEGFAESVAYRSKKLQETLKRFGDVSADVNADWTAIRDASMFAGGSGDVWRISVKPSDGPSVGAALDGCKIIYDWGGGLIWAEVPSAFDLRGVMGGIKGHATLVRGQGCGPVFHPEPAPVAALSKGVRRQFDPRGILNAGIMD